MVYTTAGDVLSVLRLGRDTGAVEVGDIYQSFDARGTFRTKSGSAFLSCSCPRRRCATRDGTRAFRTRAAVSAVSRRLHFDPDPTHP